MWKTWNFKLIDRKYLDKQTLCMTPKLAVAVNLAQLVALDNHSKLFLKKVSLYHSA